jgi:hypothetical protein
VAEERVFSLVSHYPTPPEKALLAFLMLVFFQKSSLPRGETLAEVFDGVFLRERWLSRARRLRKGLERGPACMELQRIPGDPRINPARGGGEREASRG